MTLDRLMTMVTRAMDGVEASVRDDAARDPDTQTYAGIWFALLAVSKAASGDPLAIRTLEALADGNLKMDGFDITAKNPTT